MSERSAALIDESLIDQPVVTPIPLIQPESTVNNVESIEVFASARRCEQSLERVADSRLPARVRRRACLNLGMEVLQSAQLLPKYPQIVQQTVDLLLAEIENTDASEGIDADAVQKLARDIACQFPALTGDLLVKINLSRTAHGLHILEEA